MRAKGLWQPNPQLTVSAMAEIHRNDTSPNAGEDANGNFTQVFNLTTTPTLRDSYDLYNITLIYDFTPVRFLSSTSYINQTLDQSNAGNATPVFGPPGTAPLFEGYSPPTYSQNIDNLTQELRLTSIASVPWEWTLGGSFRHFQYGSDLPFIAGLAGPLPPVPPSEFIGTSQSNSWAVFGNTSYKLADRLTLGAGVRYFQDNQKFGQSTPAVPPLEQAGRFQSTSPRVYADYKLTDQVNLYTSAAKGFRSGGFDGSGNPPFGPESVWTYELGTKMSLLQGRLSGDVAAFLSNYTNYQIVGTLPPPAPPVTYTRNAGDARIEGVEWDVSGRPADQWLLGLSGDYLKTYFTAISVVNSSYVVGDQLDLVPKYQITVSAQRDFKLNDRAGFARLDYSLQGRETFRNRNLAGPTPWFYSESNVIHMLNLNTNLQWNDSLSFGFFAQNLLNDRGYVSPYSIEGFAARSRPRTIGLQFGVKFD